MSLSENIVRFAVGTPAVIIAGRMTEAGCETSETTVRRWINGEGSPSHEKLPYLAAALNVPISSLYEEVA